MYCLTIKTAFPNYSTKIKKKKKLSWNFFEQKGREKVKWDSLQTLQEKEA